MNNNKFVVKTSIPDKFFNRQVVELKNTALEAVKEWTSQPEEFEFRVKMPAETIKAFNELNSREMQDFKTSTADDLRIKVVKAIQKHNQNK